VTAYGKLDGGDQEAFSGGNTQFDFPFVGLNEGIINFLTLARFSPSSYTEE
jgi:hypothetical protein